MNELTENRIKELDNLIEEIDAQGGWLDEYNTENIDNAYAEYCTWGWRESGGFELDYIEDEAKILVERLKEILVDKNELDRALFECSELEYDPSNYRCENEIFSVRLGEIKEKIK